MATKTTSNLMKYLYKSKHKLKVKENLQPRFCRETAAGVNTLAGVEPI